MRDILSPEGRPLLDELAEHHALVALDFDGTLAPFVAERGAAQVPPRTRSLLRATALLYPCAVISGRCRADVARRVAGIPLLGVVGNHGAEAGYGPIDRTRRERLVAWKRALGSELSLIPGVEVEDKLFSIAIHFRNVPGRANARRVILQAAARLEGARSFPGHVVVNVIPADAPDKGVAIAELLDRVGPRPVLYVGDDGTDEDVFRSGLVTVGVRVGRTARSSAPWYVAGQGRIDELLRALIDARTRRDGMGDRAESLARAVGA